MVPPLNLGWVGSELVVYRAQEELQCLIQASEPWPTGGTNAQEPLH